MYTYRHPRPAVAVDIAVFAPGEPETAVLLIQRRNQPYQGAFALPGGFVEPDEDLSGAARRELREETGLVKVPLQQIHAFGAPDRDPRGRVISILFAGILPEGADRKLSAGSDARDLEWHPLSQLPQLAFDHRDMIDRAAQTLPLT